MGGGVRAGGRAARALRFLLVLVLALAAVEYLCGSIIDASLTKTYLMPTKFNATNSYSRNQDRYSQPQPMLASNITSTMQRNFTGDDKNNTVYYNSSFEPTNMTGLVDSSEENSTTLLGTTILEGLNALSSNATDYEKRNHTTSLCDEVPAELGPIELKRTEMELSSVDPKYTEVHWGGKYSPPNCIPRHKVAIIVPYRDRQQHLAIFLNHMHPFLMKQQIEYGIFIVEQAGKSVFNRAKLMNVGFVESQKLNAGGWQCFIFHDIDLLPLDERNMYSCPKQPRHMSAAIDKFHYKLPYEEIFGGVSAMTSQQFMKVNGFSNKYWGWGGEDDDMFYRLHKMNYHIARYKMSIARYTMLDHKHSAPNPKRFQLLSQANKTFQKDGLTTLHYELVEVKQHHLYTHIYVNINKRS